eukprot:scaffold4322_cov86-Skeletonema_marinoi.AAC.3
MEVEDKMKRTSQEKIQRGSTSSVEIVSGSCSFRLCDKTRVHRRHTPDEGAATVQAEGSDVHQCPGDSPSRQYHPNIKPSVEESRLDP